MTEVGRCLEQRLCVEPHELPMNAALLYWVEQIRASRHPGMFEFLGCDFRSLFGKAIDFRPRPWAALTARGRFVVDDPEFVFAHFNLGGWFRETPRPEKYPSPPFLLTDSLEMRMSYDGPVHFTPVESAASAIDWELDHEGEFQTPVAAARWCGMLTIRPAQRRIGRLLAFSEDVAAVSHEDEAVTDDNGDPLGFIRPA